MAGTGVGKFSSTAGSNTANMSVNFAENMAPSAVNNAARELMGHMRDMYEQLGDGYFEFGDGDGTYTVARGDADTITITSASDISGIYFAGRKIRITDGGANVVEGTIASSSHSSTTQTVNLTGISLASGTPTKVELGIDTAAFGGRVILDDDGDTYIEAPTDDTIDIYVAGAKDFSITANSFNVLTGSSVSLADSSVLNVGTGNDLQISHNGSGSFIVDNGTGDFHIRGSGSILIQDPDGSETFAGFNDNGSVDLYHDNTKRFETTANGGTLTGDLTVSDDLFMLSDAAVIHFGADSDVTLTHVADTGLIIRSEGTADTLSIVSGDDGTAGGPTLELRRDSASPADNDGIGAIVYTGRNDNSQDFQAAIIKAQATDVSDGSEDSFLYFRTMHAGSETEHMAFLTTETVFNDASNDIDFRVESNDGTHTLFVNAGNNTVQIGRADSDGVANVKLQVEAVDSSSGISAHRGSADSGGPALYLSSSRGASLGDDTVVQDGDDLGSIAWFGADGTDRNSPAASISGQVDGTPGGNDMPGRIVFKTTLDGGVTQHERMRIDNSGRMQLNMSTFGSSVSASVTGFEIHKNGSSPFIQHGTTGTGAATMYNFFNANGAVGSISVSGSATAFNTSSDYRLKENVVTDWDATTRLKQLKPSRFNFIADADTTVDGFLAHEVSSIVPEAINGDKDATETKTNVVVHANGHVIADEITEANWTAGKVEDEEGNTKYPTDSTWAASKVVPVYQSIDQSKLVPLLVKTIQELEARIVALES